MHIPDGFLDPKTSTSLLGAAGLALAYCLAKVKAMVTALVPEKALAFAGKNVKNAHKKLRLVLSPTGEKLLMKMGLVAMLIFAAQMFNFPISNGTSGHFIGAVFAVVLLGPFAGTLCVSLVLIIQSLFFADGGLMALGANIINMAVIGGLLCYFIYFGLKKIMPNFIAVFVTAWFSVFLAALACSLEVGLSNAIPLPTVTFAMLKVHAVIGVFEGVITLVLIYLLKEDKKTS